MARPALSFGCCKHVMFATVAALALSTASAIGLNMGEWSQTIPFTVTPVGAAVTPNNKLIVWSSQYKDSNGGKNGASSQTWTVTMDLDTLDMSEAAISNTNHNFFCSGTAQLPDGRLLINGGATSAATSVYTPSTGQWAIAPKMKIARGYNSDVVMPDGRVFTIGGSWRGGLANKTGEIWSSTRGWRIVPGADATKILTQDPRGIYRADNHAWLFALENNKVFHAGPSKQMNFFDLNGAGSTVPAGLRAADEDSMCGNAVMYQWNKILTVGGATAYNNAPARNAAHVITIDGATATVVSVEQVQSLRFARTYHNSVVLADGDVLVLGGQSFPRPYIDRDAVYTPELFSPVTKTFRSLAPASIARAYHSVALLLPDGRVFSGGGGMCNPEHTNCPKNPDGTNAAINHNDGNIFTPPYLLQSNGTPAARPVITSAPAAAKNGVSITITTDSAIAQFSLVRLSAVTHGTNNDQRHIFLPVTSAGVNAWTVAIPASKAVAPPGYYMLFALNSLGVPSVSTFIQIG